MKLYFFLFFFFNDTATTEIYTLSLHDALPNSSASSNANVTDRTPSSRVSSKCGMPPTRSEEHTSELQSRRDIVCHLLLDKKKNTIVISVVNASPTGRSDPIFFPLNHSSDGSECDSFFF